ncbi:hypothetical protein TREMEDRAFT_62644 [Tremella mesenterica DSM 1558]|uniref:uncharacterized protein n=1 Tax=Tremella mesenterica (strain ATCC 24925 / CBS 8224 / DSM 1558 / NBRC 9311 / NRRL Y-6157 / RJB 2259-6 / UBC 559-6) TaxID=578456 RepID=UPI0003F49F22|nr:uncharacterized protein TREMEDRAFT_62644 [Tremella mesenterica DSM 1558]EIW68927.1 hypothetical protein TREMEDRAFT_62644 [Tremella mesenterica DSM 1558]
MSLTYDRHTTAEQVCKEFAPQIKGRTILVTGPSLSSLGFITAAAMAAHEPGLFILIGRNATRLHEAEEALHKINSELEIKIVQCDMSVMSETKKAAEEILSWNVNIDILVANAGVMLVPETITPEGFELTLATNYLSHFLLATLLMPRILNSTSKRIVWVSSGAHKITDLSESSRASLCVFAFYTPVNGQSKTAMVLIARQLAKRYGSQGLQSYSLCPGPNPTALLDHLPLETRVDFGNRFGGLYFENGDINYDSPVWKKPEEGAAVICRAALDPSLEPNGAFLEDSLIAEESCASWGKDPASVEKIWEWTYNVLGEPVPSA